MIFVLTPFIDVVSGGFHVPRPLEKDIWDSEIYSWVSHVRCVVLVGTCPIM